MFFLVNIFVLFIWHKIDNRCWSTYMGCCKHLLSLFHSSIYNINITYLLEIFCNVKYLFYPLYIYLHFGGTWFHEDNLSLCCVFFTTKHLSRANSDKKNHLIVPQWGHLVVKAAAKKHIYKLNRTQNRNTYLLQKKNI